MRSLCRAPGVSGSCLPRMGGVSMFLVMQSSAGGWQHSSPSQKPGNQQACRNQLVLFSDRSCPPPATQPGAPRCHDPNTRPSGSPLLTATPYESCHPSSFLQNHLPLNKSSQTLSSLLPPAPVAVGLFSGPRCHPLHPPKTPVLEFQHLQPRLALPGSFESPPVKTRSETTGSFCDFTGPGF